VTKAQRWSDTINNLRVDWLAVVAGMAIGLIVFAISRLLAGPETSVIGGALGAATVCVSMITLRRAARSS